MHWIAWNIPASVAGLPENLPKAARLTKPVSKLQGRNGHGGVGYAGPAPPPSDRPHHYHFQVFALDTPLKSPPPQADRDALLAALRGHVVAKGELVGTYRRP